MLIRSDIAPRADGSHPKMEVAGTKYEFARNQNGVFVCEVADEHIGEFLKHAWFHPMDKPARHEDKVPEKTENEPERPDALLVHPHMRHRGKK